jgi:hypothetical protein
MNKTIVKLTLDRPATYQIRVPSRLDAQWADWIENLGLTIEADGHDLPVTTLTGTVDQAALQGLLRRLYHLGLPLLSVVCLDADDTDGATAQ